jgi:hypothetical protein
MAKAQRRTGWTLALVDVLVVAVLTALAVGRHHSTARGAKTAQVAATLFVNAVNNGQGDGAAAIACNGFADGARSAARSGADPGISYRLGDVTVNGSSATAQFTQIFDVGGSTQESLHLLTLTKTSGLWLVCGQT